MKYFAFAETIDDCKQIESWALKRQETDVFAVALSLEALEYLRSQKALAFQHVWDILDMEDINDRAFFESETALKEWEKINSDRFDSWYEKASLPEFHVEFMANAAVFFYAAERLADYASKHSRGVLICEKPKQVYLGSHFPGITKNRQHNGLFSSFLIQELQRRNIPFVFYSSKARKQQNPSRIKLYCDITVQNLIDLAEFAYGKLRGRPSIKNLKTAGRRSVIIAGWGKDLWRMLSLTKLQDQLEKRNISSLTLIWRKKGISEIPPDTKLSSFRFIRERIARGISLGPAFSFFSLSIWFKFIRFITSTFHARLRTVKILAGENHLMGRLLQAPVFQNTFLFNVFYSYRAAFLTKEVIDVALNITKARVLLGSDAGSSASRTEILRAHEASCKTLSTPHGYQAYAMLGYNYLADKVLTHGSATKHILTSVGVNAERIYTIGNLLGLQPKKAITSSKIHITIATRSWGGLWSNYCSRHNVYDKELNALLKLLDSPRYAVTIKSHPNGDLHGYYDLLAKRYSNVRHEPKGWKAEEFKEKTDIVVCLGEMPSLYVEALYMQLPIVFIDGVMDKTQKKLHYDYKGLGCIMPDAIFAAQAIERLVNDPACLTAVLEKQKQRALEYQVDDGEPERRVAEIIQQELA